MIVIRCPLSVEFALRLRYDFVNNACNFFQSIYSLQSVNTDTDNPNNRNLAICRDKKINLYQCLSMLLEEKGQNLVDNVNKIMDTVEELLLPAQTTSNSAILPDITRVLSLLMNLPDDVLESAQAQYNISQR